MGKICCTESDSNQRVPSIPPTTYDNTTGMINLKNQYNDIKAKNQKFYDDLIEQEKILENYKSFLTEYNYHINDIRDHLNISLFKGVSNENLFNKQDNKEIIDKMEATSNKINEFEDLIKKQKNELKKLENNLEAIQEQLDEMEEDAQKNPKKVQSIQQNLNNTNNITQNLQNNQTLFDRKKIAIENDIKEIQNKTGQKINKIKNKTRSIKGSEKFIKKTESIFLKGSMLLGIKDFRKVKNIYKSIYLFDKKEADNNYYNQPTLVIKNWHETCYINDNYDIYDINYEIKAMGLEENMTFTNTSFYLNFNYNYEIILLEIDGTQVDYEVEKFAVRFDINLKNLESNKIHIKYKESPVVNQDKIEMRKLYRLNYYGLSKMLAGKTAKFILINQSSFEIINFEDEFFIKSGDNKYEWGGEVPEEGKRTLVRMSKKEGNVNFEEINKIKSVNDTPLKKTTLKLPLCFSDGNNNIINLKYWSNQTKQIKVDQKLRIYEIDFINTNSPVGEFIIKGTLKNRCKGEWTVNLTNEEIEALIPQDFKDKKQEFRAIANNIIKEYDSEHKDDLVVVPNVTKIGKWINKNIKYDINYIGRNDVTAFNTYNIKTGVCHHFTILLNALMYSLGYQAIYVSGFASDLKNYLTIETAHAWSLIKIEGKWLPFDATWGIFSGKLPLTHLFHNYGSTRKRTISTDEIKFEKTILNADVS